jgi:hypothetical protein
MLTWQMAAMGKRIVPARSAAPYAHDTSLAIASAPVSAALHRSHAAAAGAATATAPPPCAPEATSSCQQRQDIATPRAPATKPLPPPSCGARARRSAVTSARMCAAVAGSRLVTQRRAGRHARAAGATSASRVNAARRPPSAAASRRAQASDQRAGSVSWMEALTQKSDPLKSKVKSPSAKG